MEFENLFNQVSDLVKGLRQLDADLRRVAERIDRLERRADK